MSDDNDSKFLGGLSDAQMFDLALGSVGRMARRDYNEGASDEREAIVGWLRSPRIPSSHEVQARALAKAIEEGVHHNE